MVKTRILRGIVIAISILGAIAIVFGFLPGIDVYRDTSDCFGHAFASLFSHASSRDCESSWQLVETRSVVDHPICNGPRRLDHPIDVGQAVGDERLLGAPSLLELRARGAQSLDDDHPSYAGAERPCQQTRDQHCPTLSRSAVARQGAKAPVPTKPSFRTRTKRPNRTDPASTTTHGAQDAGFDR